MGITADDIRTAQKRANEVAQVIADRRFKVQGPAWAAEELRRANNRLARGKGISHFERIVGDAGAGIPVADGTLELLEVAGITPEQADAQFPHLVASVFAGV